jgi:hypothetical protein
MYWDRYRRRRYRAVCLSECVGTEIDGEGTGQFIYVNELGTAIDGEGTEQSK